MYSPAQAPSGSREAGHRSRTQIVALGTKLNRCYEELFVLSQQIGNLIKRLLRLVNEDLGEPDFPTAEEKTRGEEIEIKGRTMRLPKVVAALIRALKSSNGRPMTAEELGINPHTLAQRIYRLRKTLKRAGLDPRMIQTRRGAGVFLKVSDKS